MARTGKKMRFEHIFWISFILSVWRTTKSKLRNTFFFIKRVYFQNIQKILQSGESSSKSSDQQNMKVGHRLINKFLTEFFLSFLIFFSKKLFHLSKILENKLQIMKRSTWLSIQLYQQIWASSSNGGPGGRLAPPVPSLIAKMCGKWVILTTDRLCRLGIPMNCRSENDSTFETRKPEQKQKKS